MISLDFEENQRFSYRIAAVFIHDGHVLLHRADYERFWSLPGGRAEILETSRATVQREMMEELGATVNVSRLLWVVENFFVFEAKRFHELGLYYLVDLPTGSSYLDTATEYAGLEADLAPLIFRWFPLDQLAHVKVVPSFLSTALRHLPDSTAHIVHENTTDIQQGSDFTE